MGSSTDELEMTVVPREAVRFPLAIAVPEGLVAGDRATWPRSPGRLELVGGRLLYMPPCGDAQQQTAVDIASVLSRWRDEHRAFVVGGNEAGMLLSNEVRGADLAVWRRGDLGPPTGGFPRVPPVLAIEIAGRDEGLAELEDKARWYLDHGVEVVWIVDPATMTARVVTPGGRADVAPHERLPEHASLPGLTPQLAELFRQVSGS